MWIVDTVFMNSKNSKTSDPHRIVDNVFMNSNNSKTLDPHKLLLNLKGKINLKRIYKYVALSNLSNYYTWKNRKKSYKNNKFKISTPTFELPDISYSLSGI